MGLKMEINLLFMVIHTLEYPISDLLICPYPTTRITQQQQTFNFKMSTVRQVVEWG